MTGDLFKDEFSGQEVSGSCDVPAVVDNRERLNVREILQPKTVTRASYRLTHLHYHILVHIREELQAYITNNPADVRSNELITVPLFCDDYPHFKGNGSAFLGYVKELMLKDNVISFEWRYNSSFHKDLFQWMQRGMCGRSGARMAVPTDGALIQQASVIIANAMRCENDPNKVVVSINPAVLPFLLYYGPGVGGTCFDRDVILTFRSMYSCRLYENLMDWSTSCGVKVVSLEEFRMLLQYPENYKVYDIKRKILDVAKEEFENCGSSVLFDFKFRYDSQFGSVSGTRGRYPANCIEFTMYRKDFVDWKELSRKQILVMLQGVADREKQGLCEATARKIVKDGKDTVVKSKFLYYDKKMSSGKMSLSEYKNTMLKIIREVSGVDLRSESHIRNSLRSRRKYAGSGNEPKLLFD